MSWKMEVQTAGSGDTWATNALRFKTREEAERYGLELALRWTAVKDIRAAETPDEEANR